VEREEVQRIPGSFGDALRAHAEPPRPRAGALSLGLAHRARRDARRHAVLVDGTFLPAAYHFGGLGSTVSPEMLDRMDFSPGNFSARFGRATGGVVDVGSASPCARARAPRCTSGPSTRGLHRGALSPRVSAAVSARFGWIGYLLSPVVAAATGTTSSGTGTTRRGRLAPHRARPRPLRVYGCGDSAALERRGRLGPAAASASTSRRSAGRARLSADTSLSVALSAGWNGLTVKGRAFGTPSLPVAAAHFNVDGALDAWPVHLRAELPAAPPRASRGASASTPSSAPAPSPAPSRAG
jgi:hypothetical protein